jgi:hypothetical protein
MPTATEQMTKVLAAALAATPQPVPAKMCLSCARVYVTVYGSKIRTVRAAAKRLGIAWTHRGLYIGYDNATGREYMRGEAIAKALVEAGVSAFQHTDED